MQDARELTRVGLASQVRAQLLERIMDRDLPPGARLNIDALAREMGVSSSPLREALAALAARGLVRNEAFLGFSVAPMPDAEFLQDMFDTRLRLEPRLSRITTVWSSSVVMSAMVPNRIFRIIEQLQKATIALTVGQLVSLRHR